MRDCRTELGMLETLMLLLLSGALLGAIIGANILATRTATLPSRAEKNSDRDDAFFW